MLQSATTVDILFPPGSLSLSYQPIGSQRFLNGRNVQFALSIICAKDGCCIACLGISEVPSVRAKGTLHLSPEALWTVVFIFDGQIEVFNEALLL